MPECFHSCSALSQVLCKSTFGNCWNTTFTCHNVTQPTVSKHRRTNNNQLHYHINSILNKVKNHQHILPVTQWVMVSLQKESCVQKDCDVCPRNNLVIAGRLYGHNPSDNIHQQRHIHTYKQKIHFLTALHGAAGCPLTFFSICSQPLHPLGTGQNLLYVDTIPPPSLAWTSPLSRVLSIFVIIHCTESI